MEEKTLTRREFDLLRKYVYEHAGISLSDQKMSLVQGRLSKRLRQLGLTSYKQYYDHLLEDDGGDELVFMIDAISTNVTSFFRERSQWEYLHRELAPLVASRPHKAFRIWSAGCSSGEEPYSIAMFLHEKLPSHDIANCKILATDISQDILRRAMKGYYSSRNVEGLPRKYITKYFNKERTGGKGDDVQYRIQPWLRQMILFRMFNLVYGNFSVFQNPMDIIFCRNVMIYFDMETRDALIARFAELLYPGAHLFIGHSESLTRNSKLFRMVQPSIYQRI
ncbi:CheR family methyltransferase [Desulfurispira natronophila]|uniref:protein-glutamate O-methyltransferase n=1 Tax=Desulfurispira natronophila TaxID=682562 RepID=A0A7W7Y330_9BACT|nr:protein-glutamate O-methyltransferase CheR [Desulfurispira natronophila]MBB5021163.1 chemotaxis protein methyltransferase CheR [Desulfurispira natronophila]